ncbi:MAG: hypothetical protein WC908_00810 [Candidatus Paceibacterota bacterium]
MNDQKLKSWLWTGFIAIVLLFFVLSGFKSCKNKRAEKKEKAKIEAESSTKAQIQSKSVDTLPSRFTKHYFLKKGEVKQVDVPSGYSYTCSGGGKKYYHQAQNGPKEIWGDGQYHDAGKHVAYFDLYFYDEEITVVCEFKKL